MKRSVVPAPALPARRLERAQRRRAERDDRPAARDQRRGLLGDRVALAMHVVLADVVGADRLERAVADVERDGAIAMPRAASASVIAGVMCRPAVGAATAPGTRREHRLIALAIGWACRRAGCSAAAGCGRARSSSASASPGHATTTEPSSPSRSLSSSIERRAVDLDVLARLQRPARPREAAPRVRSATLGSGSRNSSSTLPPEAFVPEHARRDHAGVVDDEDRIGGQQLDDVAERARPSTSPSACDVQQARRHRARQRAPARSARAAGRTCSRTARTPAHASSQPTAAPRVRC